MVIFNVLCIVVSTILVLILAIGGMTENTAMAIFGAFAPMIAFINSISWQSVTYTPPE